MRMSLTDDSLFQPFFFKPMQRQQGGRGSLEVKIVRVQYFVRGGFVRHRSRVSSKHLSPHLPVDELDSSGGQTGVALHLQMHVWVSGPQRKPTRC
ncbi:hypothetical protein TNCV_3133961 [Trichonephila clavipes]|nr:hypothetical protein TNCV_3133961 [Trichonephila clavipes]